MWLHQVLAVTCGIFDLCCSMQDLLAVACELSCSMWDLVPRPWTKAQPLHWEHRVLATGPPRNSPLPSLNPSQPSPKHLSSVLLFLPPLWSILMSVLEMVGFHPYSFYVHNRQQIVLKNIAAVCLSHNTITTLTT